MCFGIRSGHLRQWRWRKIDTQTFNERSTEIPWLKNHFYRSVDPYTHLTVGYLEAIQRSIFYPTIGRVRSEKIGPLVQYGSFIFRIFPYYGIGQNCGNWIFQPFSTIFPKYCHTKWSNFFQLSDVLNRSRVLRQHVFFSPLRGFIFIIIERYSRCLVFLFPLGLLIPESFSCVCAVLYWLLPIFTGGRKFDFHVRSFNFQTSLWVYYSQDMDRTSCCCPFFVCLFYELWFNKG